MRPVPLKLLVAIASGAAVVGASVAAAVLLRPGSAPTAPSIGSKSSAFPAPPRGAVVYSRELGTDALALGVVPQQGRVLVQASVLGSQGEGVTGLTVSFRIAAASASATRCGPGCYRATLPVRGRPASVEVALAGTHWRVALPSSWPPPSASALVSRAGKVWRSLRSLTYSEHLASGPRHAVTSSWQVRAPDRIAYQVNGGWASVIVGAHRWDRPPSGRRWTESPQTPVTQPQPFWVSAVDAHVLGTAIVHGRPAWRVSFFDPGTPAWFDVLLDRATLHTLELRMITTGHFMHDVYGSFNATPAIVPPS